jgi:nicotinamidase/pyrazinamidase
MSLPALGPADALILVDVQNDFCPGGALPVKEGDQIVPLLNQWIEAAREGGAYIIASRDWHPPGHVSFRERGGSWPVHCVQNTSGAAFHSELRLPPGTPVVSKGTDRDRDNYSALEGTELAEMLRKRSVRRVWIGGLALDVCVRATVLDALREGFEVHLIEAGTRPVVPRDGRRAVAEMRVAGCFVENGGSDA